MNKVSVSTKFYTYKIKEYCSGELEDEWNNYNKDIISKVVKYYDKTNVTRDEVKLFLDNQKLDTKLIKTITDCLGDYKFEKESNDYFIWIS